VSDDPIDPGQVVEGGFTENPGVGRMVGGSRKKHRLAPQIPPTHQVKSVRDSAWSKEEYDKWWEKQKRRARRLAGEPDPPCDSCHIDPVRAKGLCEYCAKFQKKYGAPPSPEAIQRREERRRTRQGNS